MRQLRGWDFQIGEDMEAISGDKLRSTVESLGDILCAMHGMCELCCSLLLSVPYELTQSWRACRWNVGARYVEDTLYWLVSKGNLSMKRCVFFRLINFYENLCPLTVKDSVRRRYTPDLFCYNNTGLQNSNLFSHTRTDFRFWFFIVTSWKKCMHTNSQNCAIYSYELFNKPMQIYYKNARNIKNITHKLKLGGSFDRRWRQSESGMR